MKFIIITPSYNQLKYLKRCMASIQDQTASGLHIHHHVQDGKSSDGTLEYLAKHLHAIPQLEDGGYSFSYESVRDEGMYDALNKAVDHCRSIFDSEDGHAIVAWLNCDEQYLNDSLTKIAACFNASPDLDLVYGNTLNLDEKGELLSFRKCPPLRATYIKADHLYVHSASMFFNAKVFSENRFDTMWRAVSDIVFVLTILKQGCKARRMDDYLSVFTMTGENLSGADVGCSELKVLRKNMPFWIRGLRWPINVCRYLDKLRCGGYREKFPLEYSVYGSEDPKQRLRKCVTSGTFRFSWGRDR